MMMMTKVVLTSFLFHTNGGPFIIKRDSNKLTTSRTDVHSKCLQYIYIYIYIYICMYIYYKGFSIHLALRILSGHFFQLVHIH